MRRDELLEFVKPHISDDDYELLVSWSLDYKRRKFYMSSTYVGSEYIIECGRNEIQYMKVRVIK